MRPISQQIAMPIPALIAIALVLLAAAPFYTIARGYVPNIAWLVTLVMAAHYPSAWPRGFAFFLGLLQDLLFGTPLGSQALLALLLTQVTRAEADRQASPPFRLRWLESAGMLLLWHLLLWLIIHAVNHDGPALTQMLLAGLVSALWYPLFYAGAARVTRALPGS